MSRKTDLEGHIRESYELIHKYEEILRLSGDPQERARAQRAIKNQRKLIKRYLEEYIPLCQRLEQAIPGDIAEIAAPQHPSVEVEVRPDRVRVIIRWYRSLPAAQQVAIIVALIGFLGTLVGASIGALPDIWKTWVEIRATPIPTEIPTLTPTLPPTSTPSPTPSRTPTPTSTHTPSPSPTSTPTPIPVTPIPMGLITQQCRPDGPGKFEKPGEGFFYPLAGCDIPEEPDAVRVSWDVSRSGSYAGCIIKLPPEFASIAQGNTHLVLWMQGDRGGEQFKIGLVSSDGAEWKEIVPPASVVGHQLSIPLSKFENRGVDLAHLEKLVIAFEYYLGESSRRSSICIGEIGFGSP